MKKLPVQHYVMPAAVALACCFSIWAKVQPKPQAKPSPDPAAANAAAAAEAKRLDDIKQEAAQKRKKTQLAQLQIAERMSKDGLYKEVDTIVAPIFGDPTDEDVFKKAEAILKDNHPTTQHQLGLSPQTLFQIAAWGIDIVLGIVVLFALYRVLKFVRYVRSMGHRGTWRVDSIPDGNGSGLGDATVASLGNLSTLGEWSTAVPPVAAGLLKLERLQLPTAKLDLTPTPLDLSAALQDLNLEFGGISLKGIAGAGRGLRGWFDSTCPSIKGKITQSSSGLTLRLTSLGPDGRANTVTAAVAGATSTSALGATVPLLTFRPEDIRNAAEAASYQILYLIAMKGSTPIEAEAADKLREGLNLLGQSIYDQNPEQLVSAYDAFRLARTRQANLFEAYLYEGIALDLLQQHDEAIARFEYLEDKKRVADIGLREKAAYNRAISLFRKYKQRDAEKAAGILEKLMFNSQIKLMARAARASVIAQYPMYWREQPANGAQAADVLKAKTDRHPDMLKLISEVTIDKEHIERELAGAKSDRLTEPNENQRTEDVQLEWAIKSAWGTLYLNSAIYFYAEPCPDQAWKSKRQEHLRIAYNAFQECAMLITPGIEILTNLAKVCLELDRIQQGCSYLEQALKLNPSYEYAYYRLARVRAERKEIPQLLSVLRRCEQNLTPTIAGFVELFRKYDVLLHPSIPNP